MANDTTADRGSDRSLGGQVSHIYNRLLGRRRLWEPVWQDIAMHMFPRRSFQLNLRSEGESQVEDLFDSTANRAGEVLAASLQSGLSNQAIKWFGLSIPDPEVMEDEEVLDWLEDTNARMLLAFTGSNFGTESSELYLDLGFFGVSPMLIEENPESVGFQPGTSFRGLRFETIPLGSYVIDEDAFGRVNLLARRLILTTSGMMSKWQLTDLSDSVQQAIANKPDAEIAFIQLIAPVDRIPVPVKTALPIASIWIEEKTKHVVSEGGYHEFPIACPRWSKAAGEAYGRGPGYVALPDAKTLNKLIELNLKAMALAAQPPTKSRFNSVIGSIDLSPGGNTVLREMNDLDEIVTKANFNATQIEIADLRASIERDFFVNHLLQILARETPQMTATEVTAKMQLLREIVGPVFVRLEHEFLNPVIDRVYNLMLRSGAIQEPPEILGEDRQVDVDYQSPIGLAKRGQELVAMDRVTLKAQELAAIGKQEVLDALSGDDILELVAEIAGAPRRMLVPRATRLKIRQQRAKDEADAETLQGAVAASEAARNLAPLAKVTQESAPPERR